MDTRLIVGCMSGTSLDAIDAALVGVDGRGLSLRATPLRFASRPLGELSKRLRAAAQQVSIGAGALAELSAEFSRLHVGPIRAVLAGERANLVVVHGQTIYHRPPTSWQLLTPALIARETAVPVLFNLRAADLAAGGQGAPITPLADYVLFGHALESRAIVNLGGFANYSWLPAIHADAPADDPPRIRGADVCACNQLLDGLARRSLNQPFDDNGRVAASGHVLPALRSLIVEQLRGPARAGRSLGSFDEPHAWLDSIAARGAPADVLASACDAVATVVAAAIPPCERVLLAGGGAHNASLLAALKQRAAAPLSSTDEVGVPAAQREAIEMAVLGALCQDRIPITLPQITGCGRPAPVAGEWAFP